MNYYNQNPMGYYQTRGSVPMAPTMPAMPQPVPQPAPVINGKIVDSEEMVRATEVPMGGYGVFPKADLPEIYLKIWYSNGTTGVVKYKPEENKAILEQQQPTANDLNQILDKINALDEKIDNLITTKKKTAEVKIKDAF